MHNVLHAGYCRGGHPARPWKSLKISIQVSKTGKVVENRMWPWNFWNSLFSLQSLWLSVLHNHRYHNVSSECSTLQPSTLEMHFYLLTDGLLIYFCLLMVFIWSRKHSLTWWNGAGIGLEKVVESTGIFPKMWPHCIVTYDLVAGCLSYGWAVQNQLNGSGFRWGLLVTLSRNGNSTDKKHIPMFDFKNSAVADKPLNALSHFTRGQW